MTTTPKQPQPPTRAQPRRDDRGMSGNQKLILAVLATIVTLFCVYVAAQLALNGQGGAGALTGVFGPIVGNGGLFWLFDRFGK